MEREKCEFVRELVVVIIIFGGGFFFSFFSLADRVISTGAHQSVIIIYSA